MFVPHQLGSSSAGRALKARIQTHLSDLCLTHSNGQSGMLVLCMYFEILSVYFAFSPTQSLHFRSPMFVRQPFSKPQIASFKALQRRIWWFCKGQKETHVSLVSAPSGIIWTYCEGNAASVWTLKDTGEHGPTWQNETASKRHHCEQIGELRGNMNYSC